MMSSYHNLFCDGKISQNIALNNSRSFAFRSIGGACWKNRIAIVFTTVGRCEAHEALRFSGEDGGKKDEMVD
jgi:hypothetical protein